MATGLGQRGRGAGALAPPDAQPAVASRRHSRSRAPLMARLRMAMVEQSLGWLRAVAARHAAAQSVDQFVDRRPGGPGLRGIPDGTGAAAGRDAAAPGLEVTETMIANNQARPPGQPGASASRADGLSMDDYGIGYSSMQTLSRSPFTGLKIVRLFVGEILRGKPARRAILTSAIGWRTRLTSPLGGGRVEPLPTGPCSASWAATPAQGYLLARPCPRNWCLGAPTRRAPRPGGQALTATSSARSTISRTSLERSGLAATRPRLRGQLLR